MYGDAELVDETFLSALGVFRFPTPLEFLEAGGPANVYALENPDGTWTLFDTGIGTPDALSALRSLAADARVELDRVSDIIISHGHLDHFGNAQLLSERSGARVWVHPADLGKVVGDERHADMLVKHRAYLLSLGLDAELLTALADRAARSAQPRYLERHRLSLLADGQVFHFKHLDAVVRHLPGHTPGLVCLHAPAQRLFFADDHVLAKVSPNPLLDLSQGEGETKFLALVRYLESAKWVRDLELDAVLPGHGESFRGHRSLLDGLLAFYVTRQDKLHARLKVTPSTIHQLLEVLFVRRDASRLMLMLSEVLANVEVLEVAGRVRRERRDDGVFVFHAV